MEYLMTYSWAILVVLVVGLVLWQMGVFNQGQGTTTFSGWPQIKPIAQSTVYPQAGNFQTALINTLGTAIQVTNVSISDNIANTQCTNITVKGMLFPANVTVSAGEAFAINADCPTKQNDESYNVYMNVTYTVFVGGSQVSHTEEGYIAGTAE